MPLQKSQNKEVFNMNLNINKTLILVAGVGLFLALSSMAVIYFVNAEQTKLTPSETLMEYHNQAMGGNITETEQYVSKKIHEAFDNGAFPHYGSYANFIIDYSNKMDNVTIIKGTETIKGETASVEVINQYKNEREERTTYYFVKEEGNWKIAE